MKNRFAIFGSCRCLNVNSKAIQTGSRVREPDNFSNKRKNTARIFKKEK